MEPLPFLCPGQTLIPAMNKLHDEITASTPLPVWECSLCRTFCTAGSNLGMTQKLAPSPSSQLPQRQLCSAPGSLGKLLCFGMQIPNFHPPVPVH